MPDAVPPVPERPDPHREHYVLARLHAKGGIGQVWVARDTDLGRDVALKELRPDRAGSPLDRQRFLDEAQITGQLEHPNIVPVYELAREPADGQPFYTMRLVKGRTLREAAQAYHRRRRSGEAGPLELPRLLEVFISVCNAVAYAHARGVVHRDLKGQNVILGDYGEVLVVDWGLAKVLPGADLVLGAVRPAAPAAAQLPVVFDADDSRDATRQGQVVGTPYYMAPEQAEGKLDQVGRHTDVYGLGAILFDILTGRPPFQGKDATEVLWRIVHGKPPRAVDVEPSAPPALSAVCARAMARSPVERYPSAMALAEDVERYLAGAPVQAWREPRVERTRRWLRRRRRPVTAASLATAVVATLALCLCVILLVRARRAEGDQAALVLREREQVRHGRYVLDVGRVRPAWDGGRVGQALGLLDGLVPRAGERDERGFEWYYFDRLCHAARLSCVGHTGVVHAIACSPDGRRLATAGADGLVFVWDVAGRAGVQREPALALRGHEGQVYSVAFSPDGTRLATAGWDQMVRLWDVGPGRVGDQAEPVRTLAGHESPVQAVAFAPDGKHLAAAGWDGAVTLWDVLGPKEQAPPLTVLKGHTGPLYAVAFAPDGKRLASAGGDGTVRLWDVSFENVGRIGNPPSNRTDYQSVLPKKGEEPGRARATGEVRSVCTGHAGAVHALAFRPDGRRLASAGADGFVHVWDVGGAPPAEGASPVLTLAGGAGPVAGVAFSPDGRHLASGGAGPLVRVWDADGVGRRTEAAHVLKGHTDAVTAVAFHPGGRLLASAGTDGTAFVWDAFAGQEAYPLADRGPAVRALAVHPVSRRLAVARADGVVELREALTGQLLQLLAAHTGPVAAVAFNPDGTRLATAGDRTTRLWVVRPDGTVLPGPAQVLEGHTGPVEALAFGPHDEGLLTAGQDQTLRLWHLGAGVERLVLPGHTSTINAVAFAPDGKRVASGAADGSVRVWDLAGGPTLVLKGHRGSVRAVAFHPGGGHLATAGDDHLIRLWDVASGRAGEEPSPIAVLSGHGTTIHGLAWSPDGNRLASAAGDPDRPGEVKLWDVISGQEVLARAHPAAATALAFTPDGKRLISADERGSLLLWEGAAPDAGLLHARDVGRLVDELFSRQPDLTAVRNALRSERLFDDALRQDALARAERYVQDPERLALRSLDAGRPAGAAADVYRRALVLAEVACRLAPDRPTGYLATAVARYRLGQFAEAEQALARARQLRGADGGPAELACRVLVLARQGRRDEARSALTRLTSDLTQPGRAPDVRDLPLVREAEAAMRGK